MENSELTHWGIKGMKWGVRRYQNKDGSLTSAGQKRYSKSGYKPTSPAAFIADRKNKKVDKSFERWKENDKLKEEAISLGKKATSARIAMEKDPSNRDLKKQYRDANNAYKKALSKNTTYRKGSVKSEVGKDASRKYLSEAKKLEGRIAENPNDTDSKRKYDQLMSRYAVERSNARRAQTVAANRSRKIASIKATTTKTVKRVAATAAVSVGVAVVNQYLTGNNPSLSSERILNLAKKGKSILKYL